MVDLQVVGCCPVLLVQTEDLASGAKCDGSHITAPTADWTDSALPRVCGVKRYCRAAVFRCVAVPVTISEGPGNGGKVVPVLKVGAEPWNCMGD